MFGSQILEVATGMIFIFLLVSVVCSAVREGIEALIKTRAAYLENGIRKLLHDNTATGLANSLYSHPLIEGLFPGKYKTDGTSSAGFLALGRRLPSYIPSKNFAIALMDLAARGKIIDEASSTATSTPISLDSIRANIQKLGSPAVQRVMLTALDSAQGDINKAQAAIEAWYDSGMDRVSGLYKRKTQWIIFWIGLALAVGLNINSLNLLNHLYTNAGDRAALTRLGGVAVNKGTEPTAETAWAILTDPAAQRMEKMPIGWTGNNVMPDLNGPDGRSNVGWHWLNAWIALVFGWLITAFAASMGAPFWFDMLNKVSVIRSTVKPHEKSPEEGSKDRQPPVAEQPPATDVAGGAGGEAAKPPAAPPVPPAPPPGKGGG